MAHELEIRADGSAAMFSVKQTPWHNLGQVVSHAPNIEAVLALAGLNWNVGLQPLYLANGHKVETQAIVRETDSSVLGYVTGQRYKPLQNAEALDFFRPFHDSGLCTFETAGSLRDGKRIWILARLNSGEMEIVNGDVVRKYLLLSNSHDGKMGVRIGFTPIRVICANTLAIAHTAQESKLIRMFHSKKILDNLAALRETVNIANQTFEATAEQYRQLTKRQVNQADLKKYVDVVFYNGAQAETDREKIAREKLNEEIKRLFEVGYGNSLPGVAGTAWALYNGVTQMLSYSSGRTQDGRLDSLWFGVNAGVNERALKAALRV